MNSPDSILTSATGSAAPSRWLALPALLAAPLVAAIVEKVIFILGARVAGYRPASPPFDGIEFVYFGFALVFIPLGGALMMLFWRWAPFGAVLSSAFGAVCGALAAYIVVGMPSFEPDQSYAGVAATMGLGVTGGVAGGLTIWLICRLGSRRRND